MAPVFDTLDSPRVGQRQRRAAQLREEALNRKREEQTPPEPESSDDKPQFGSGPIEIGDQEFKDGDCISSLADEHGRRWDTIWEAAENKQLRDARVNPNVLLPRDRITLPPKVEKHQTCATEQHHRFVRLGEPTTIRVRLLDDGDDKPIARRPFQLSFLDGSFDRFNQTGATDADGWLTARVPSRARRALLKLGGQAEESPTDTATEKGEEEEKEKDIEIELRLGGLDPIDTVTGIQDRLENLGYFHTDERGEFTTFGTEQALRDFQHDAMDEKQRTGVADADTRKALLGKHGS